MRIDEWNKNPISNLKYIIPMQIMIVQVKATPETVLKAFWKKIMFWMYDLTYKNAIANTKRYYAKGNEENWKSKK